MLMRSDCVLNKGRKTDRLMYTSRFVRVICSSCIVLSRPRTVTVPGLEIQRLPAKHVEFATSPICFARVHSPGKHDASSAASHDRAHIRMIEFLLRVVDRILQCDDFRLQVADLFALLGIPPIFC